jgi:choice-of-anchor B domain-containing protein
MKKVLCFMQLLLLYGTGFLMAQGSPNVQLLAHVNDYPSEGYNDCWGYVAPDGREYALLGVRNGTSILDITDTNNVTEVVFIPSASSTWKDIKTYQHYAYVVTEASGGMQIIDLSDLPNSATVVGTVTDFQSSHNIYIDVPNAIIYIEGNNSNPVYAYSLADPVNPTFLSSFGIECHDIFARDNIAYISEGSSGSIGIYDLNNPTQPVLLQRLQIPSAGYVHNAWLTDDSHYMMTTEETIGKTIKMWDISDLNNITFTDDILAPGQLAHNAHIKGKYAYVSHYSDGLRIYDISDPYNIVEAGYYDTADDWGAYPFFASGKILISDIDDGLYVVFFEGAREGDPLDPNPPANVIAYSDFNTPTSIMLNWEDPTSYFNGDTLMPGDFTIEISTTGGLTASIPGGIQTYEFTGLTDGQLYDFVLQTRVIATDSTSKEVTVSWYAGGSPIPAAPTNLECQGSSTDVLLTWEDPVTQSDGTPLDDLDHIEVLRNGAVVAIVPPGTQSFVDTPTPGFTYTYTVVAVDNETPPNNSAPSNSVDCYVGDSPDYLVWVGPTVESRSAESADSLFAAIAANGGSVFLTNNLFEFGNDLSIYKAVFVVLGVYSDNHILGDSDPEPVALEAYLQNGGKIYLEGGDCFNYDPENGGYNIRPWFGLNDGPDGTGDVAAVTGLNGLSTFNFSYDGPNNWMDELQPATSVPIWKNSNNSDVLGVYNENFGNGLAIGVVPSFGGMQNSTLVVGKRPRSISGSQLAKAPRNVDRTPRPFVKKYEHRPELAGKIDGRKYLSFDSAGKVVINANNKIELMAAYLQLLNAPIVGLGEDRDEIPTAFELSQNYPNPFNPATTFTVTLPQSDVVSVVVYNALGQIVAKLHDGKLSAGKHSFTFDAARLASGLYFYRVTTTQLTKTRKMMLIK